jgi:hypothetical protein
MVFPSALPLRVVVPSGAMARQVSDEATSRACSFPVSDMALSCPIRFSSIYVHGVLPFLSKRDHATARAVCREWQRGTPAGRDPVRCLSIDEVEAIIASLKALRLPWCEATTEPVGH